MSRHSHHGHHAGLLLNSLVCLQIELDHDKCPCFDLLGVLHVYVHHCVCVSVIERESEREREEGPGVPIFKVIREKP